MIKEEKWTGNPLANYIHKLYLKDERVVLTFDVDDDDKELDPEGIFEGSNKLLTLDIDLKLSA